MGHFQWLCWITRGYQYCGEVKTVQRSDHFYVEKVVVIYPIPLYSMIIPLYYHSYTHGNPNVWHSQMVQNRQCLMIFHHEKSLQHWFTSLWATHPSYIQAVSNNTKYTNYSMDWFKGKSTGNHGIYHQI